MLKYVQYICLTPTRLSRPASLSGVEELYTVLDIFRGLSSAEMLGFREIDNGVVH